jgi:hypothetical protein
VVEANQRDIAIRCLDDNTVRHFLRLQFELDEELPQPAACAYVASEHTSTEAGTAVSR